MLSDKARARLGDIVEDSWRIDAFLENMTVYEFLANERTLFAIERLLQRITEAAIQIPAEDAMLLGTAFPLRPMRALGNRLRHEYRDIDRRVIFEIARDEVPGLRAAAELALER